MRAVLLTEDKEANVLSHKITAGDDNTMDDKISGQEAGNNHSEAQGQHTHSLSLSFACQSKQLVLLI